MVVGTVSPRRRGYVLEIVTELRHSSGQTGKLYLRSVREQRRLPEALQCWGTEWQPCSNNKDASKFGVFQMARASYQSPSPQAFLILLQSMGLFLSLRIFKWFHFLFPLVHPGASSKDFPPCLAHGGKRSSRSFRQAFACLRPTHLTSPNISNKTSVTVEVFTPWITSWND